MTRHAHLHRFLPGKTMMSGLRSDRRWAGWRGVPTRGRVHPGLAAAILAVAAIAPAAEPVAARAAATRTPQPPTARPRMIDPNVKPAGGPHAACAECRKSACPQCRLAEERHPAHGPCQHGLCPAHCPVRPDVFGFYGTQWRRWPGSAVVQASHLEAATPVRPSRSAVPGPLEESLPSDAGPDAAEAAEPAAAAVRAADAAGVAIREQFGMQLPRQGAGAQAQPSPAGAKAGSTAEMESMRNDAAGRFGRPPASRTNAPADAESPTEPLPRQMGSPPAAAEPPGQRPGPQDGSNASSPTDDELADTDDAPRSTPWRAFTAAARRDARANR